MTNAELISKIKAEIERLKGICTAQIKANPGQTFPFVMEMTGYDKLLSFLSTLEESEKPTSAEGLEEEAVSYCFDNGLNLSPRVATDFARHFAQWGAEHAMSKIMKEAVDAKFVSMDEGVIKYSPLFTRKLKQIFRPNDKVRIIILKEDKNETQ